MLSEDLHSRLGFNAVDEQAKLTADIEQLKVKQAELEKVIED